MTYLTLNKEVSSNTMKVGKQLVLHAVLF